MRTRWLCLVLSVLLNGLCSVGADPLPFQPKPFVQDGTVQSVDTDRDRVVFQADNGRRYTLDMADSTIAFSESSAPGTSSTPISGPTSALKPGMRLHLTGKLLAPSIVEALQLRVLSSQLPKPTEIPDDPHAIMLRGTITAIDQRLGTFLLFIKEHTRTILLADDTDLSGLGSAGKQAFPVKIGDRVSVAGALQPDGSVLAGAISFSRDIAFPVRALPPSERVLIGRISSRSDRLSSRDIKIRLRDNREVKIKVARTVPVRRDGQLISVHDLREEERVRVFGSYDGIEFKGTRIEVLRSDTTAGLGGFSRL